MDEANQVTAKCRAVATSRLRYRTRYFGIRGKLLITCNPAKNWVFSNFVKPWKDGQLAPNRAFIQALVTDDPHIDPVYVERLKNLPDKAMRECLLFGIREYYDDPNAMFHIDALHHLFTNQAGTSQEKYLSVDVARFGAGKIVAMVWTGLQVTRITSWAKSGVDETPQLITSLCAEHEIRMSHILVDEDDIGGGVVDTLQRQCKGFAANAAAIQNPTEAKHTFKVN